MIILGVHGAFRGGWAWRRLAERMRGDGHVVIAPSLVGMGEHAPAAGNRHIIRLSEWTDQLVDLVELEDLHRVVLIGHSQGGFVVQALGNRLDDRLAAVCLLDSPLGERGQRGVDMGGGRPPTPEQLPPSDTWLEPTPLLVDDHHPPELVEWVNARLCATPLGPSLDPIDADPTTAPVHLAFCDHTPSGYPSALSRRVLDDAGGGTYTTLEAAHDAPLTHPELVAEWLCSVELTL